MTAAVLRWRRGGVVVHRRATGRRRSSCGPPQEEERLILYWRPDEIARAASKELGDDISRVESHLLRERTHNTHRSVQTAVSLPVLPARLGESWRRRPDRRRR